MRRIQSLSTELVEFYPIPETQARALAKLRNVRMSWADYAAMKFPVVVGRLTPKGQAIFAPQPETHAWISTRTINFADYSKVSASAITQELFKEPEEKRIYQGDIDVAEIVEHQKAQMAIVQTLAHYDKKRFGAPHARDFYFNLLGEDISANRLFARPWHDHPDNGKRLRELAQQKILDVPKRIYAWRSNTPMETIRNEWRRNAGEMVLHPLIMPLLDAQQAGGWNQARKWTNWKK